MARPPRIFPIDAPEVIDPEREALRGLDDATVAKMTSPAARAEMESRLRFEAAWSGEWNSDPPPAKSRAKPSTQSLSFRERHAPLPAVPIIDGRESQHGFADNLPRNPKERLQANIARFSKLSDEEIRMLAMQRTSPESKAARHIQQWRRSQQK